MHAYYDAQDRYLEGKAAWEAMSWREQGDLLDAMPDGKKQDARVLYAAALVWEMSDRVTYTAWARMWAKVIT